MPEEQVRALREILRITREENGRLREELKALAADVVELRVGAALARGKTMVASALGSAALAGLVSWLVAR